MVLRTIQLVPLGFHRFLVGQALLITSQKARRNLIEITSLLCELITVRRIQNEHEPTKDKRHRNSQSLGETER